MNLVKIMIFIIPERISSLHICFSVCIRNNPIMMEKTISFNDKIIRCDLIPIPIPFQSRFLARMIPTKPISEIIIFIIMIIFLIYTLPTHTYLQLLPVVSQQLSKNFALQLVDLKNIQPSQKMPVTLVPNKRRQLLSEGHFDYFRAWKKR